MDKTIIKLLFRYDGSITSSEFKIGISILVMLVGTISFLNLDALTTNSITRFIPHQPSSVIYIQLAQNFKPSFIPINFILTYSSFMLVFKRVSTINDSKALAIISGIINYLFFASLVIMANFSILLNKMSSTEVYSLLETPNFIYYTIFFILVGSINLISLLLAKRMENANSTPNNKLLDVSEYSLKIGKLILFTLLASFVTIIFSKVFGSGPDTKFYITVNRLIALSFSFFYLKYSWHRLRDANISVVWLFVALATFASIYILRFWLAKDHPNILGDFNFVAGVLLSVLIAAQYSLLLLPSHYQDR